MSLPLVLIPSISCDARLFADQILNLSMHHVVILAPITQGSRIEELSKSLLNRLPSRFAVAGLGMGGNVVFDLLRIAPDRVDRACVMNATLAPDTPSQAAMREPQIVAARAGRLEDALRDALPVDALAPGPERAEVIGQYVQMGQDLGVDVFARQTRAMQRRGDQHAAMAKCKVPVLLLSGEHDTLIPTKRMQVMADLMPSADLRVIEGAGHLIPLEQSNQLTSLLRDWLDAPLLLR